MCLSIVQLCKDFIKCFIYTDRCPLTILMLPSSKCLELLVISRWPFIWSYCSLGSSPVNTHCSSSVPSDLRINVLFNTKHVVERSVIVTMLFLSVSRLSQLNSMSSSLGLSQFHHILDVFVFFTIQSLLIDFSST